MTVEGDAQVAVIVALVDIVMVSVIVIMMGGGQVDAVDVEEDDAIVELFVELVVVKVVDVGLRVELVEVRVVEGEITQEQALLIIELEPDNWQEMQAEMS